MSRELDFLYPALAIIVVGISVSHTYRDTHMPPKKQTITVYCPNGEKTVVPKDQPSIIVQCEVTQK